MPIPAGTSLPTIPTIQPAVTGTTPTPASVTTALQAINGNVVAYGATLIVTNASGATVDVLIIDADRTPAGNPANQTAAQVAAGTTKSFKLDDHHVDRATNQVVVAFQPTSGVSAQVIY